MNVVDAVIIVLLAVAALSGFRLGLVFQVIAIVGAIVGLIAAKILYQVVRHILLLGLPNTTWVTAVSYLFIFLVVWAFFLLLARGPRFLVRLFMLGMADRLGGAVLGFLEGLIVVELLLYIGKRVPNHDIHHAITHSKLAPKLLDVLPFLHNLFPHMVK
jgi:membrane protein required for colicin V production